MRPLIFIFFFSLSCIAQETTSSRKAAKAFREAKSAVATQDFVTARTQLKSALFHDENFVEAWILLGDVNIAVGDKKSGIDAYRTSIPLAPRFSLPMYYRLAMAEHTIGDYSEALQHIRKYLTSKKSTETHRKKALALKRSCEFSISAMKNPVSFDPINLGSSINTDADEYLPALSVDGSTLIFTRSKKELGHRNEDFYMSYHNTDDWELAEDLGRPINTAQNEGAQCITADGNTIYFTACSRADSYGRCDIYQSNRIDDTWSEPVNLGPNVNTDNWESQPAISADGRQLFFVSNRPGGIGGKDIWVSYKTDKGTWTQAKNLGKDINTKKDDISPFLHWDNQTLYFSSKGYLGMGGFDIFLARLDASGHWGKVKNIGYPINSPADENSLIVAKDGRTAYFASSHFNTNRSDLDLYTFDLPLESRAREVAYLQGSVSDAKTGRRLAANIDIVDLASGRAYKSSQANLEGEYMLCLPSNTNYALTVSKDDYLFYSEHIALDQEGTLSTKNFMLQKLNIGELVRLNNIFFEHNKAALKESSITELNKIVQFMDKHPLLSIELGGHTDNSGSKSYNLSLSERRAQSVKETLVLRGVNPNRIQIKGYGMTRPLNDNLTAYDRAQNRRTELKIISIE